MLELSFQYLEIHSLFGFLGRSIENQLLTVNLLTFDGQDEQLTLNVVHEAGRRPSKLLAQGNTLGTRKI